MIRPSSSKSSPVTALRAPAARLEPGRVLEHPRVLARRRISPCSPPASTSPSASSAPLPAARLDQLQARGRWHRFRAPAAPCVVKHLVDDLHLADVPHAVFTDDADHQVAPAASGVEAVVHEVTTPASLSLRASAMRTWSCLGEEHRGPPHTRFVDPRPSSGRSCAFSMQRTSSSAR